MKNQIYFYKSDKEFQNLLDKFMYDDVDFQDVRWVDESIASYISVVIDLCFMKINNFTAYEKYCQQYVNIREYLLRVNNLSLRIPYGAKHFILNQSENYPSEYSSLNACKTIAADIITTIDTTLQLPQIVENYKAYWDDVLNNYKRKDAYKKRLIYLVDDINSLKCKDYFKSNEVAIQRLIGIQQEYEELLSSI